jgi:phage shock protein A
MGIIRRVSDVWTANLHELIEQYERPEPMLKQALREMESSLDRTMHRAAEVIAAEKLLTRQAGEQDTLARHWQLQAEQALDVGDEASARRALKSKHSHTQQAAALAAQLATLQPTSENLRSHVGTQRQRLREAKAQLAALLARQAAAEAQCRLAAQCGGVPTADDPFQRFARFSERVEQSEAQAEALIELAERNVADEERLNLDEQIDAELRLLKAHRGVAQ